MSQKRIVYKLFILLVSICSATTPSSDTSTATSILPTSTSISSFVSSISISNSSDAGIPSLQTDPESSSSGVYDEHSDVTTESDPEPIKRPSDLPLEVQRELSEQRPVNEFDQAQLAQTLTRSTARPLLIPTARSDPPPTPQSEADSTAQPRLTVTEPDAMVAQAQSIASALSQLIPSEQLQEKASDQSQPVSAAQPAPISSAQHNSGIRRLQERSRNPTVPVAKSLNRTSNTNKAWNQQDYIGGGSLIHPSVVLTAAHTVHRLTTEQLKCRAGEWNTQTPNEFYPYQERNVKKIIIHPDFHSKRGHNDIALLFLESPFDISSTISVACLGRTMAQVGMDCYSMGWGQRVFNNSDDHAVLLKKVPLPIVARRTCEYYLKNTILGPKYKLHDSLICAGGLQGVDTCTKDGGSPLVCPIGNENGVSRYAVYGVVAFGIQCGQENVPGVYSSVPNVYEWLVATMVGEGMDTSQFMYS